MGKGGNSLVLARGIRLFHKSWWPDKSWLRNSRVAAAPRGVGSDLLFRIREGCPSPIGTTTSGGHASEGAFSGKGCWRLGWPVGESPRALGRIGAAVPCWGRVASWAGVGTQGLREGFAGLRAGTRRKSGRVADSGPSRIKEARRPCRAIRYGGRGRRDQPIRLPDDSAREWGSRRNRAVGPPGPGVAPGPTAQLLLRP
jgi:hypothetical protein